MDEQVELTIFERETHAELVRLAERHLRGTRRCVVVLTETGVACEMPDAIGWTHAGISILIECKRSLPDYYADQRKPGRKESAAFCGLGSERWYLIPKGLLNSGTSLPPRWGVMESLGSRIRIVRPAERQPEWNRRSELRMLVHALAAWEFHALYYRGTTRTWHDKYQVFENANRGLDERQESLE